MKKRREKKKTEDKPVQPKGVRFFSTGCQLLDLALGGGFAEGRIINIVGDRSTGKTLQAIEACANFSMKHPNGRIRYKEAEAAFDVDYAETLGLPVDQVEIESEFDTVEELQKDILRFAKECDEQGTPGLYILDSLDALSDLAEQERDIDKGSYGSKAKLMSEMFRRNTRKLKQANITLIIISQIRDKLNVTYGRKTTRSGGKALDFYASQIIYLVETKKVKKTVRGQQRTVAIEVLAKVEKNKVGMPFREAAYTLVFGYGIDDLDASLKFLKSVKVLRKLGVKDNGISRELDRFRKLKHSDRVKYMRKVNKLVKSTWDDIEEGFRPPERKYL